MVGLLATRLAGSSDLYEASGRRPYHSINFVTSHDGFTLNDLVSYNEKHNEANGEGNRDGDNNNYSYNYGAEGVTRRPAVEAVRLRQIKNLMASLMLSQGVPMLLAGDECRRTQGGNNNAYCQDNEISWFDWKLVEKNAGLRRFCESLIAFRKSEPTVRQTDFLRGRPAGLYELPDVSWYGPSGGQVEWFGDSRSLVCLLGAVPPEDSRLPPNHHVLIFIHAGTDSRHFVLPPIARPIDWRMFLNTAAESPCDIYPSLDGPAPANGIVTMESRSMAVYVARDRSVS
jgi:glycogen operon protein